MRDLRDDIAAALTGVGIQASIHACDVDGNAELDFGADNPVVLASVFKVPVLLELNRQAAAGALQLTDRIHVPAEGRALGPTGLSIMRDPAEMSLRDLAVLMMSISDNAATDVLIDAVGLERVNSTLRELELARTRLKADCRTLMHELAVDAGFASAAELLDFAAGAGGGADAAEVVERLRHSRVVTPAETTCGTPREVTRLLQMIWRGEAGTEDACAETRRIMALQLIGGRVANGFPDNVVVSGKTGTLPFIRNEAAVVEYPDGGRYAVAIFTRSDSYAARAPEIDRVIGEVARLAVDHLRANLAFDR